MSESLDMLKTEDGQLNAVFACFGSEALHAQMFAEALGNFLLAYNHIRPTKLTAEELEELTQTVHGRTMGKLLCELKKLVTFSDGAYEERMKAALKVRNFLMHRWFIERQEALKDEPGRMALVRELVGMERLLDSARVMANAMRIAMCRTLGIEDIWLPKQADGDAGYLVDFRSTLFLECVGESVISLLVSVPAKCDWMVFNSPCHIK